MALINNKLAAKILGALVFAGFVYLLGDRAGWWDEWFGAEVESEISAPAE